MGHRLTDNQLRYILAERFTDSSFPIPVTCRFAGRIDVGRLEKAVASVMERHAVLRSRFYLEGDQYLSEELAGPFRHHCDIQHLPAYDEAEARRRMIGHFYAPVESFTPDTLIKTQVIFCGPEEAPESVVTLSLHHCISDGVSTALFIEDVFGAYNGEVSEAGESYAALAARQPVLTEEDHAFWAAYLADLEPATLAHDLRASVPLVERRPCRVTLPQEKLEQLAVRLGARPFHVVAALTALLYRWTTGKADACFTYQSAGRHYLPRGTRVIGPFSNTLIMRLDSRQYADLPALVAAAAEALQETRAHEYYPRRNILSEFNAQTPFGINFYPASSPPEVEGLRFLGSLFLYTQTEFGVDFRFEQSGSDLELYAFFDPEKYSEALITGVITKFCHLLDVAAANPATTLADLLPAPTTPAVADRPALPPARLYDAFLATAQKAPDRLALADKVEQLTYAEVEQQSAAIAAQLLTAGLGPGARVAIHAERTAHHVLNLLGVLRAGAVAVPLDSDYPDERLATLIDVARPAALLSAHALDRPAWAAAIPLHLVADRRFPVASLPEPDPAAPAYILFTSGSTGRPKGVATSHLPINNFLGWQRATFGITAEDRFSNLNGLAHDMIMRDIFAPLSVGASLHIPEQEEIFIPGGLARWCAKNRPTFMHLTPAMAQMIMAGMAPGDLASVRTMIFGGDRLLPELTEQIYAAIPDVEIVNFYGATETPQAATFYRCMPGIPWRCQPIGRGISHFTAEIVDEAHQPLPDGVVGEISITSPYLSLGYMAEGEIRPHANPDTYYTGDQGFVLPDGDILFVGRTDDQVSIRGARVELGEITAALKREPGVRDALVLMEHPDNPRLVAFVAGDGLEQRQLRAELTRKLPRYMVPADIVLLDALLLLPNGKPDRQKMLALPRRETPAAVADGEMTGEEEKLIAAWAKVLGHADISPAQSFADLGGDSLNYVQAFLVTESLLGVVPDDWENLPIRELARQHQAPRFGIFGRFITTIESVMLTRAIAITLIVALHLRVFRYGGGGTTALMLVSGILIGRNQIVQVYKRWSAEPLLRLTLRVFFICLAYVWLFTLAKWSIGVRVHPSVPTLTANFVNYPEVWSGGHWPRGGVQIHLWYVSMLIQAFAILTLFMWLNLKTGFFKTPLSFAVAVFIFGCFGRFILPGLLDSSIWRNGIQPFTMIEYAPTTHIGTTALGMMIGLCWTWSRKAKMGLLMVVAAYAGLTAHFSPSPSEPFMLLFFGGLILFVPRLPIVRGLSIVVLAISGSSLFVYLTHRSLGAMLVRLGLPEGSYLLWVTTMICGALCWVGWQFLKPPARAIWAQGSRLLPAAVQKRLPAIG